MTLVVLFLEYIKEGSRYIGHTIIHRVQLPSTTVTRSALLPILLPS